VINGQEVTMDGNQEKVVHINTETGQEPRETPPHPKENRGAGKAALFLSILTVLLLAVFFYALNRNMAGLADEVRELGQLRGQVGDLDARMLLVEDKMAILDAVPEIARRTMLRSMLQDLSQRAAFIADEVGNEEQSRQLRQAVELLAQVGAGFGEQPMVQAADQPETQEAEQATGQPEQAAE
jgi:hypothetical protein